MLSLGDYTSCNFTQESRMKNKYLFKYYHGNIFIEEYYNKRYMYNFSYFTVA